MAAEQSKCGQIPVLLDEAEALLRKARKHRHSLQGTGFYAKRLWEVLGQLRVESETAVRALNAKGLNDEADGFRKTVGAIFSVGDPASEIARARTAWSALVEPALLCPDSSAKPAKEYFPHEFRVEIPGHLRNVFDQVEGCHSGGQLRDATLVMIRKLTEGLIIEGYEISNRGSEIKHNGDYIPFGELVGKAKSGALFRLSRDSKASLNEVKKYGDNAAHNPRFQALQSDLEKLQPGARVLLQDLLKNLQTASRPGMAVTT